MDDFLTIRIVGPREALLARIRKTSVVMYREVNSDEKAKELRANSVLMVNFTPQPIPLVDTIVDLDRQTGVIKLS